MRVFGSTAKSRTLDNLEQPLRTPLHKTCIFRCPSETIEWRQTRAVSGRKVYPMDVSYTHSQTVA